MSEDTEALQENRPSPSVAPVAVVGVGVSAASLRSLETLFAMLPRDHDIAYVVVSESAEAVAPERLLAAISGVAGPPARIAEDGEKIEPDQCYIAPAAVMTTFADGHLRLKPAEQEPGSRGTIDTFLISLAEEEGQAAVAILLPELEATGSIGFVRLKECGGLALAVGEPGEAPGPEETGGAEGLADIVTPLANVPVRLLAHVNHLRETEGTEDADLLEQGEARLPAIADILRARTGHDFHGYKSNTFLRRVQRRMHVVRIDDVDAYVEHLRANSDEVQHLFQDLLIGVTQFFRDPTEFGVLEREVVPDLLARHSRDETIRLWVLGCATGEEAYSLAILLHEAMSAADAHRRVQIFATDIDGRALAVARAGRYPQSIEKHITPERLARWFVREGGTYCVHRDLREMCIFSAHNIVRDAPFSRIDLVSCRNLLIYLNSELQERVIPLFHFSLRKDGILFLGPSENVTRHTRLFQPIDRRHRIFRRVETATRVVPEFPLTARATPRGAASDHAVPRPARSISLARSAERVVERYTPAYVIVDSEYEVLNFSGRTGPFLNPTSGVANLNLLNLVHRDLRLDLRGALHHAAVDRSAVHIPLLRITQDGDSRRVGLTIEPMVEQEGEALHFVVMFHDHGNGDAVEAQQAQADASMLRDEHVLRVESELRATKDRLQATIEELESTNEELKSSNEEYQSINEELQSANEELETSKEELQAVNEELQTVNGELAHRVAELARANSDLKNLLESTQIATLFLDNDLRVKSFTPSMADIFHLIDSDHGRLIAHIAPRVPYPELDDDVRRVLRTLATVEHQIGPPAGPRYLVRLLPYRSIDNFIAGVVITFLDVTETTRAQAALRAAQDRARLANAAARAVTWEVESRTGRFRHSEEFEATLGFAPPATLSAMLALMHPSDRERVALAFDHAMAGQGPLDVEGRVILHREEIWLRFSGARSGEDLLGVFQNVTDRRRAEAQRSLLVAELQHRVKNILAVVRSLSKRTVENSESLEDFSVHFAGRIDALARTQGLLTNRDAGGVELDQLVRDELAASLARDGEQVTVDGPDILLMDKAAETVALALHELTTNAVKYGALSSREGRLDVRWRIMNTSGGARLSLEWQEAGVALLDTRPSRAGFGRTLIERGLPYDLGATTALEFAPGGVRCTIELPLGPRVVAREYVPGFEADEAEGGGR